MKTFEEACAVFITPIYRDETDEQSLKRDQELIDSASKRTDILLEVQGHHLTSVLSQSILLMTEQGGLQLMDAMCAAISYGVAIGMEMEKVQE